MDRDTVRAVALTNRGGTLAGSGAQVLAPANGTRRYLLIVNVSARVMWIDFGATAVAAQPSIPLKACAVAGDGTGGAICFEGTACPVDAVSIIGTSGDAFAAKEG